MLAKNDVLVSQAKALIDNENNQVANLSNLSALIMMHFEQLNWAGFYLVDAPESLVLGPFQGLPACIRIPFSKGVCGKAARWQQVQRVADVHAVADHIACDANSNSELVAPVVVAGKTVAVIDLDSPKTDRFSEQDADELQALADWIAEQWPKWTG